MPDLQNLHLQNQNSYPILPSGAGARLLNVKIGTSPPLHSVPGKGLEVHPSSLQSSNHSATSSQEAMYSTSSQSTNPTSYVPTMPQHSPILSDCIIQAMVHQSQPISPIHSRNSPPPNLHMIEEDATDYSTTTNMTVVKNSLSNVSDVSKMKPENPQISITDAHGNMLPVLSGDENMATEHNSDCGLPSNQLMAHTLHASYIQHSDINMEPRTTEVVQAVINSPTTIAAVYHTNGTVDDTRSISTVLSNKTVIHQLRNNQRTCCTIDDMMDMGEHTSNQFEQNSVLDQFCNDASHQLHTQSMSMFGSSSNTDCPNSVHTQFMFGQQTTPTNNIAELCHNNNNNNHHAIPLERHHSSCLSRVAFP